MRCEAAGTPAGQDPVATPLRLLLAEDSHDDALLVVRELERAGYEVNVERIETAASLEHAIARERWDLVISDYSMPGFTGREALEIVRRHDADLPFIFVSGTIGEEVAVAAMRAGAQDYVMKGNLRRLAPVIQREMMDAEGRRQRRIAEEQLRVSSDLVRSLFTATPLAVIGTDVQGRVTLWNPAAERLFGWAESEVLGSQNPGIPADRADEQAELRYQTVRGTSLTAHETQRVKRDGTRVDVSISVAATHDATGLASGAVEMLQDLTARKALEAQFLQSQKMEAVGRLAGGVAHDFNNLLTVIVSYCDMLLTGVKEGDAQYQDLHEILKAGERASALARQMLAFSRQNVIRPKVVELNAVLTGTMPLLERLMGSAVRIDTRLAPGAGRIRADTGQLEQVIMNLAINARDAMPEGGTLTIETRLANAQETGVNADSHVAHSHLAHSWCLLSVTDTGTGMDAATQARVFEPFFTTKDPGKGTGLGLAMVYGIVEQSEGVVRLDSAPGKGTQFRLYFPSAAEAGSAPMAVPSQRRGLPGGETILLVDDEPAVRGIARRALEKFGYVVLEASDAQTALRFAQTRAGEIHVLVTDAEMPGMRAHDLVELQRLRPEMKVLCFAGQSVRAGESGTAFLQKPFSPDQLAREVRNLLA